MLCWLFESILALYLMSTLSVQESLSWPEYAVRLAGGSSPQGGRVEIYHQGRWGTVCNDDFDGKDAIVVCRQLGYPSVERFLDARHSSVEIGTESQPIFLDNLECNGTESVLADCKHPGLETHNCGHVEDVAVFCSQQDPQDGQIQLVGGSSDREGLVEIYYGYEWGYVCDSNFTDANAAVLCKQLGFQHVVRALTSDAGQIYGLRPLRVWLNEINCQGNENTLADCPHGEWGDDSSCSIVRPGYLGIICSNTSPSDDIPLSSRVRLVDGSESNNGRVEIFNAGEWATVCDSRWGMSGGHVLCRQLGFPSVRSVIDGNQWSGLNYGGPGNTSKIAEINYSCKYQSSSLYDCALFQDNGASCQTHLTDAGVICNTDDESTLEKGSVRLVGGESPDRGRLEIAHAGLWGTVCDDLFQTTDASVACRQMGYTGASQLYGISLYGAGSGPIWLDNMDCNGNETRLADCAHSGWESHNCAHSEDVAFLCLNETEEADCQTHTTSSFGNRRVQNSDFEFPWNELPAGATEFTFSVKAVKDAYTLLSSTKTGIVNDATGDVGIPKIVIGGWSNQQSAFRCNSLDSDDTWQQFPTPDILDSGVFTDFFVRFDPVTKLVEVGEIGQAAFLSVTSNCPVDNVRYVGITNGHYPADADWEYNCNELYTLRLVGGPTPLAGRLEIKIDNVWGTVCDDRFDLTDAGVACRQLGFTQASSFESGSQYGLPPNPIHLDDLECNGDENRLIDCPRYSGVSIGVSDCSHGEDVALTCLNTTTSPVLVATACEHREFLTITCNFGDTISVQYANYGRLDRTTCNVWQDWWSDNCRSEISSTKIQELCHGQQQCTVRPSNELFGDPCAGTNKYLLVHYVCEASIGPTEGDLRLVGGSSPERGRLEIYHVGAWGTVCDDYFNEEEGQVACRQLGFTDLGEVIFDDVFGTATDSIWLDDVRCVGTEQRLSECRHPGWGIQNCGHSEDVGLRCVNRTDTGIPFGRPDGTLRLTDGPTDKEGRLEVFFGGTWGTICDDYFDTNAGLVACRQLGFAGLLEIVTNDIYGVTPGGPIWLDDVRCIGNETMVSDCRHAGWSVNNCGHVEDVGVRCSDGSTTTPNPTPEGTLRLVGGETSGRLDIFHNGEWGSICDDFFDGVDGGVACRQLGFTDVSSVLTDSIPIGVGQIWLDDLHCNGDEDSLMDCTHNGWGISNCGHTEDVGVACISHNSSETSDGTLRLVQNVGSSPLEGRLEIYHNGVWGTVCDDDWDGTDGDVACQQLGFVGWSRTITGINEAVSQPAPNQIWLDNLVCTGSESRLVDCGHPGLGIENCGHNEDVGIMCFDSTAAPNVTVRLVGGPSSAEGRLEVFNEGEWGTVCDDYFAEEDGLVVCKQLGFASLTRIVTDDQYGIGSGRIWLDDVDCSGTGTLAPQRLEDCSSRGWGVSNCGHVEDVALVCSTDSGSTGSDPNDGDVRLIDSVDAVGSDGLLQVYHSDRWGAVCDDLFGEIDGEVACRQMGYATVNRIYAPTWNSRTYTIWLDNIECSGSENRLSDCPNEGWGNNNCGSSDYVGLECGVEVGSCPRGWVSRGEFCYYKASGLPAMSYWEAQRACQSRNSNLTSVRDQAEQTFLNGFVRDDNQYMWIGLHDSVTENNWQWDDGTPFNIDFTNWADGQPDDWNGSEDCAHFRSGVEVGLWNDLPCDTTVHVTGYICKQRRQGGGQVPTTPATIGPQEGQLRLQDGPTGLEGRLEIYHNGEWGTICDDLFGLTDATVACKQLGFVGANRVVTDDTYGYGTGTIWLDNLECTGSETTLASCPSNGWANQNCGHSEDIGIACSNTTSSEVTYLGCFRDREDRALDSNLLIRPSMTLETCFDHCRSFGDQMVYAALQYSTECRCGGTTDDYAVHGAAGESDCGAACGGNSQQKCGGTWRNSVYGLRTSENDLRLSDGSTPHEGRLEIFHNGDWGTICDDYFTIVDAQVACRQLGFGNATSVESFGSGSGSIWLDDLNCGGTEISLHLCANSGWGTSNCGHGEDVGIRCTGRDTGGVPAQLIRLVGGNTQYEGRLEVFHSGQWGTVCDDYFTLPDGHVVCRELGFGPATRIVTDDSFGIGTGTIWLDDIDCAGTEPSLTSCTHGGWGVNNCGHTEDVGVGCTSPDTSECYTDLLGQDYRGTVSVTSSGETCQRWTSQSPQEHTRTEVQYPGKGLGDHNYCRNPDQEPGGAWCYTTNPEIRWQYCDIGTARASCEGTVSPEENSLRLVTSGTSTNLGRLEIFHEGQWGTVCDDDFDLTDGGVACRQLGFAGAERIDDPTEYAVSNPILMDNVRCGGDEELLADCPFAGWGVNNCGHSEDVILVCTPEGTATGTENAVRLVDGVWEHDGRVEIFHDGSWGTVCDDGWTLNNGHVVCRQLGYESAQAITLGASFGIGSGYIWLDQVDCNGREDTLAECTHSGWNIHNCGHGEDAGVVCSTEVSATETESAIRLVGGGSSTDGRLEVYHLGQWGTVCNDDFDTRDAQVACRQLGYTGGAVRGEQSGSGPIWLDNMNCVGHESALVDCSRSNWGEHNCGHSEDVAIACDTVRGTESSNEGAVRLIGGSSPLEGRVEIFHANEWGTICDDDWTIDDGNVACRQMGFEGAESVEIGAAYGPGIGAIWLDNLRCTGSEERLSQCSHVGWGSHNCGHGEDAGVTCVAGNRPLVSQCPTNVVVNTPDGSRGIVVQWNEPVAINRQGVRLPVLLQTHHPGAAFYPGTTIVTYIFLDTNSPDSIAKCTFTVTCTVLDTTPPHIFGCPVDTVQNIEVGEEGARYTWTEPYARDDGTGNATLVRRSHAPGILFPQGVTYVSYVFADNGGNQATCSFGVDVRAVDTTAPVIKNCPTDISVLLDGNSVGKRVSWLAPIVNDNSKNPSILMQSHTPGTVFPQGTTIVTYVFTDPSHNLAKCSFKVNVRSGSLMVDVTLTMDREFQDAFNDRNSPQYNRLEKTVVSTMDDIFAGSSMAQTYSMTEVIGFSPGSIEVSCRVHLNPQSQTPQSPQSPPLGLSVLPENDDIQAKILTLLQTAALPNGLLAELGVSPDSIVVVLQTPSENAPIISSCPTLIERSKKAGDKESIVSWVEPVATDPIGMVPLAFKTHSPGTAFEVGSTVVKYTFGRTPVETASCIFTVKVTEGGSSSFNIKNCPEDISIKKPKLKDGQGITVTWKEPWATYMSKNASLISQSHKPGDTFAVGKTMVSYIFTTKDAIETSCDFAVLINTDGKGNIETYTGAHSTISVAGLVIAIIVSIILLLVIIVFIVIYRKRRQSGYSMEMQSTNFDAPASPMASTEYKSFF